MEKQLGKLVLKRTYLRENETFADMVKRSTKYNMSITNCKDTLTEVMMAGKGMLSGRLMWIGGTKVKSKVAMFNCAYMNISHTDDFGTLLYTLMCGTGVGLGIEKTFNIPKKKVTHMEYMPVSPKYRHKDTYMYQNTLFVGDSKEGWKDALNIYMTYEGNLTIFYDNVRPKGEKLKTFGGTASGHESLKTMFEKIDSFDLSTTIGVLDTVTCIAENVICGGVRRSAEMILFDKEDKDILNAKANIQPHQTHRYLSNNTVVYTEKPSKEELRKNIMMIKDTGEPGIFNKESALKRNPHVAGLNPCVIGETKVLITGGSIKIEDLSGKTVDMIDDNGNIASSKVFSTGIHDVVRINDILTVTKNHKLETIDNGLVEAQNIQGMRLKPYLGQHVSHYKGYVKLGVIQCGESIEHDEILDRLQFDKRPLVVRGLPKTITEWSKIEQQSFLRGLYSANGPCLENSGMITLNGVSKEVIDGVHSILLGLGIKANKQSCELNIQEFTERVKFYNEIGFIQEDNNEILKASLLKGYYVKSVQDMGKEVVYSCNVPTTNRYITEGFISKNCGEILLEDKQFCNLVTINLPQSESITDLFNTARVMTRACIRVTVPEVEIEEFNNNENIIVGVCLSGWQDYCNTHPDLDKAKFLSDLRNVIHNEGKRFCNELGIKAPHLYTSMQPDGTKSIVMGNSNGCHWRHSEYYIRRVRINKNNPIVSELVDCGYELIEENDNYIVSFYIKSPKGQTMQDIDVYDQFDNYLLFQRNYVDHNTSITISLDEHEWDIITELIYDNWDDVVAVSLIAKDNNYYDNMPFEAITEEQYINRPIVDDFDFENIDIFEDLDSTECTSGHCPVR